MGGMNKVVQIEDLALEGLQIDGGHHKQWYLEKILEVCGWEDPKELQKACPHEEVNMDLDIMFDDLTEECQKRVLKGFGVSSPEEMNWDVFPFTSIPVDKGEYVEMEQVKKGRKLKKV